MATFASALSIGSGPTEPTGTLPDSPSVSERGVAVDSENRRLAALAQEMLLTTRAPLLDVPDPLRVASCSRSAVTQSLCTFQTISIYDIIVITHKF